jgi:hypothetical protein
METRSYDRRALDTFGAGELARLESHANKLSKSLLKHIGASLRPIDEDCFSVKLGKLLNVDLPELSRDTYQITFSRRRALQEPLVEYGSFGHPLFDALLDYCTGESFAGGLTCCRTIVSDKHAGFRGFQFNYIVSVRALHESRQVIPVVISSTGQEHPEISTLVLDQLDWRNPQQAFDGQLLKEWPNLVAQAREKADQLIFDQLEQEVAILRTRALTDYEVKRRKVDQSCDYREQEGRRKLEHTEGIVERLRASGREEDRRILPPWERNLESARSYLEILPAERHRLLRDLDQQLEVNYSFELLNAAWIMVVK